jgi:hypothetical protein
MSESNSNVIVKLNTIEEISNVGEYAKINEVKEIPTSESASIPIPIMPLMTGADEVSVPSFEDKKVLEIKTDLKAIGIIANIKPEPNSFLIKIEQMVNYIKSTIGNEKINATNIVIISTNLMLIVEQYKDLTGYQKKMLILDAIKKYINQNVSDEQERVSLMIIVDMTLPQVLDTLVTAINGDMKFEKNKVSSGFNQLFCCGSKK